MNITTTNIENSLYFSQWNIKNGTCEVDVSLPHFTDEAQRGGVTRPGSPPSQAVLGPGLEPRLPEGRYSLPCPLYYLSEGHMEATGLGTFHSENKV